MLKESANENLDLLRKIKDGDAKALQTLTEQNAGLVKKIALRFIGRGVEYEDLVQIGTIGMIKAATKRSILRISGKKDICSLTTGLCIIASKPPTAG